MSENQDLEEALDTLSRKWHPRIIQALLEKDKLRFSELKQRMDGISNKALASSLERMEEQNLVQKGGENSADLYSLTEKGEGMEEVLESIQHWSAKFSEEKQPEILIVEDDRDQADLYRRWLSEGYDIKIANDKKGFFEKLDGDEDVVVLDRELPKASARDLIQNSDVLQEKPVLVLTGKEADEDVLEMEISGYMLKPVSKDELEEKLKKLLRLKDDDSPLKRLASLLEKKEALERGHEIDDDQYAELSEEIRNLKQKLSEKDLQKIT